MLQNFQTLAGAAAMQRITLALNHVLASEPVAVDRMRPHAGRSIQLHLDNWPTLLPKLPGLTFAVTPAGLLEWLEGEPPAEIDLQVTLDAANPAKALVRGLAGGKPHVEVVGNAQLAADVSWLIDNLRWDVQDDLARIVGTGPAREITRFGGMFATGLREAVRTVSAWAERAPR
jgi:ubiquinone biosynthesis protein UbiJ